MPISDDNLGGRSPRVGTITFGRTRLNDKTGRTHPIKTYTPTFHTNNGEVANAILEKFGGKIYDEGDTYKFDVVIEADSFEAFLLPASFYQWLESWKTATCLRRCDGDWMQTVDGERVEPLTKPCLCKAEMQAGGDRTCKPSTMLNLILDLDVPSYAPWALQSTAWGSAGRLKGVINSLAQAGIVTGVVPVTVNAIKSKVRDPKGGVQTVGEFDIEVRVGLRELASLRSLSEIVGNSNPSALNGHDDEVPALSGGEDETPEQRVERQEIITSCKTFIATLDDDGKAEAKKAWVGIVGSGVTFEDADAEALTTFNQFVEALALDQEEARNAD